MIVGAGATGVVFSEHALINPIFYRYFRPIVSRVIEETGFGFFLFISTPRGLRNHFTEMFSKYIPRPDDSEAMKKIKDKWLLKWIPAKASIKHDGERMLSDEFLEQERIELGNDVYEQEYELNLTASNESLWYGKQIQKMNKEDRIQELGRWETDTNYVGYIIPGAKVYISFDLGITDSMCLTFFQIDDKTNQIRCFYYFEDSGKVTEYYINELKQLLRDWRVTNYICILPHDADFKIDRQGTGVDDRFNTAIKRSDIFRQAGLNIHILNRSELGMKKTRVTTRINTVRKFMEDNLYIDSQNCFILLEAIKSYRKKFDKQSATYLDEPVHDWASDKVDSFGYFFVYLENFGDKTPRNGSKVNYTKDTFK